MTVTATPAALEAVARLQAAYGPLVLFQSGGCCDGSSPICLQADELPMTANDLLLGDIDGVRFYIDSEQYERWRRPDFIVDVAAGRPEGFSLGPDERHFVTYPTPRRP